MEKVGGAGGDGIVTRRLGRDGAERLELLREKSEVREDMDSESLREDGGKASGSLGSQKVVGGVLSGAGGCGAAVIDLTSSGYEGSGKDAGCAHATRERRDNAEDVNYDGATNVPRESLPNTPILNRTVPGGNPVDLTPNFRSAAAMAGWDDEALLMAATGQDSPGVLLRQSTGRGTPEVSAQASCSDTCGGCIQCRERKRGTRTPAATPLSAARRHRRLRRRSSNEELMEPIPMALLNDEREKCGGPGRINEGSNQEPCGVKENMNPVSCVKTTSLGSAGVESKMLKNEAIQLEKLREELTCVVCLDVCFEPSTTSCGHSFCRCCLQSVFRKCGMRCPKCRQQLRSGNSNSCSINTTLWNTIQLLFPGEIAIRFKDEKKSIGRANIEKDPDGTEQPQTQLRPGLVRRVSRPTPWRDLTTSRRPERTRPGVGSFALFQRASDLLELGQSTNRDQHGRVDGMGQLRGRSRRPTFSYRNEQTLRQEEEDAALAQRLQESFISEARISWSNIQ